MSPDQQDQFQRGALLTAQAAQLAQAGNLRKALPLEEEAMAIMDRLARDLPKDQGMQEQAVRARQMASELHLHLGNIDRAAALAREALAMADKIDAHSTLAAECHRDVAVTLLSAKQPDEALVHLGRAMVLHGEAAWGSPEMAEILRLTGMGWQLKGDEEQAKAFYAKYYEMTGSTE